MKRILSLMTVLLLFVGCQEKQSDKQKMDALKQLESGAYDIEYIDDKDVTPKRINLIAMLEEMQLVGNVVCNKYTTSFKLEDDFGIFVKPAGVTQAACEDQDLEREYLERLAKVRFYAYDGEQLILKDENKKELMRGKKN